MTCLKNVKVSKTQERVHCPSYNVECNNTILLQFSVGHRMDPFANSTLLQARKLLAAIVLPHGASAPEASRLIQTVPFVCSASRSCFRFLPMEACVVHTSVWTLVSVCLCFIVFVVYVIASIISSPTSDVDGSVCFSLLLFLQNWRQHSHSHKAVKKVCLFARQTDCICFGTWTPAPLRKRANKKAHFVALKGALLHDFIVVAFLLLLLMLVSPRMGIKTRACD